MSEETYVNTVGRWEQTLMEEYGVRGKSGRYKVSPMDLLIDYDVVASDRTMPGFDDAEAWSKIFDTLMKSPDMVSALKLDLQRVFKHVARQAGARNVDDFFVRPNVQVVSDEQAMLDKERGNAVPVQEVAGGA